MSDHNYERLSAFLDGELPDAEARELMENLGNDTDLRERWARYHLISQALKRELPDNLRHDLARRVHHDVETEPTILAPQHKRRVARPVLRQIVSLAAAASLTAVAILGIQSFTQEVQQEPTPLAASTTQDTEWIRVSGTRWDLKQPAVESKLNSYFVNHSEYASATGIHGILPYARIVGYDVGGTDKSSR